MPYEVRGVVAPAEGQPVSGSRFRSPMAVATYWPASRTVPSADRSEFVCHNPSGPYRWSQ
jgi:hypothetical protein